MTRFDPMWDLVPYKMRSEVNCYVKFGYKPSLFFWYILTHDFYNAIYFADEENRKRIVSWHTFLELCIPGEAHGSREKVAEWQKMGGLIGGVKG